MKKAITLGGIWLWEMWPGEKAVIVLCPSYSISWSRHHFAKMNDIYFYYLYIYVCVFYFKKKFQNMGFIYKLRRSPLILSLDLREDPTVSWDSLAIPKMVSFICISYKHLHRWNTGDHYVHKIYNSVKVLGLFKISNSIGWNHKQNAFLVTKRHVVRASLVILWKET